MAKVLIYSRPGCGYCKITKQFLKDKGVEYTEKNIDENFSEVQEKLSKAGVMPQTLPIVFINGEYLTSGNNSIKDLKQALGKS